MRALTMLAAMGLLTACALAPRLPSSPTQLEYSGRFSVSWRTDPGENNAQRASGNFLLRVDGPRSELEVSSPLGQTLAVARVAPGEATLVSADGARFSASDAQTLTEQAFGWPAPLAQLPLWLAGASSAGGAPAAMAGREAAAGPGGSASPAQAPTRFIDANWQVSIDEWQAGAPRRQGVETVGDGAGRGHGGLAAHPSAGTPLDHGPISSPLSRR